VPRALFLKYSGEGRPSTARLVTADFDRANNVTELVE
jgi:hypothetical protein